MENPTAIIQLSTNMQIVSIIGFPFFPIFHNYNFILKIIKNYDANFIEMIRLMGFVLFSVIALMGFTLSQALSTMKPNFEIRRERERERES